jgi:hypothetical protein
VVAYGVVVQLIHAHSAADMGFSTLTVAGWGTFGPSLDFPIIGTRSLSHHAMIRVHQSHAGAPLGAHSLDPSSGLALS